MSCETKRRVGRPFNNERRLIREADLIPHIVPFSKATLWRMVRAGAFPEPVRLSPNIVAWRATDVDEWIGSRTSISERQRRYS